MPAARLARTAVTGAALTVIGLVAGLLSVHYVLSDPPPLDTPIVLLILTTVVVGVCSTLLGAVSIYHIRAAHGSLVGLELAYLSAACMPLAAFDLAVFGVTRAFVASAAWDRMVPAVPISIVIAAAICVPVNIWIVRRGWRTVVGDRLPAH